MAATSPQPPPVPSTKHQSFIAPETPMQEFTWRAVLVGTFLGMIFGASSLFLTLKVGLTVSASIPVAVISLTLFRSMSRVLAPLEQLVRNAPWWIRDFVGFFHA